MCPCSQKMLVQLPVESNDYYTYFGRMVACVRILCRGCGGITLHDYYAEMSGRVTNIPVIPLPNPGKVVLSQSAYAWLEKRRARGRAQRERAKAKKAVDA